MNLKSVKKLALCLCLFSVIFTKVINAECDYKLQNEISTAAANVKAQYELEQVVVDAQGNERPDLPLEAGKKAEGEFVIFPKIKMNVYNVTEKIYIIVENEDDGLKEEYHYNDLVSGEFEYNVPDVSKIRKYTITINAENSECGGELRKIEVKTPMYNYRSRDTFCENSDKYYCKEFITEEIPENVSYDSIYEMESEKQDEKENDFLQKNGKMIVTIVMALILLVTIVGFLIRKNRNEI